MYLVVETAVNYITNISMFYIE